MFNFFEFIVAKLALDQTLGLIIVDFILSVFRIDVFQKTNVEGRQTKQNYKT